MAGVEFHLEGLDGCSSGVSLWRHLHLTRIEWSAWSHTFKLLNGRSISIFLGNLNYLFFLILAGIIETGKPFFFFYSSSLFSNRLSPFRTRSK